jgi:hypothetical protein
LIQRKLGAGETLEEREKRERHIVITAEALLVLDFSSVRFPEKRAACQRPAPLFLLAIDGERERQTL